MTTPARKGRPSRTAVLAALDQAIGDLESVGGLPLPVEAEEIWKDIWYEETHNSTAIEGNTLILKEVKVLLEQGKAVGDKELREYLEVQGYATAANWIYAQAVRREDWGTDQYLTLTELREIHRQLIEPVWDVFPPESLDPGEGPGSFRKHDIHPFDGGMAPPPFPDVPPLVNDWIKLVNAGPEDGVHPMHFLADLHASFEQIHPFRDGNGRTGRLVLNLLLVRHGYPPAIIQKRQRSPYLKALDKADNGDTGALTEMLARTVKHSIDRFLLPGLAGPHRLIPLAGLADKTTTHRALLQAAKRGRLHAVQHGAQWYSTRKWVDEYKNNRYKRASAYLRN